MKIEERHPGAYRLVLSNGAYFNVQDEGNGKLLLWSSEKNISVSPDAANSILITERYDV